jgi:hypothetical protein
MKPILEKNISSKVTQKFQKNRGIFWGGDRSKMMTRGLVSKEI